jgi:outer membrane protein assembly factor BamB
MRRAICCAFSVSVVLVVGLVECPGAQTAAVAPPAPLLPAEVAWSRTLEHTLSAAATGDGTRIYIPLTNGQVIALARESGDVVWTADVATRWPLVAADQTLFVASESSLVELDPASGVVGRRHVLPAPPTAPMARAGDVLVIPVQPSLLIAWHTRDSREVWRQSFDAPVTGPPAVDAARGLVIAASGERVAALALSDGARRWTTTLAGTLMQPIVVGDRVIVGSDSDDVYGLDTRGRFRWRWPGWSDVVGVTADPANVYVASLDNIVRAFKVGNADHQWRKVVKTRLTFAPQLAGSTLVIGGIEPALTAFSTRGDDAGKYELPELTFLAAPPLLLQGAEPDGVTMVLFTGHKEVFGLRRQRPKAEPEHTPVEGAPGQSLP